MEKMTAIKQPDYGLGRFLAKVRLQSPRSEVREYTSWGSNVIEVTSSSFMGKLSGHATGNHGWDPEYITVTQVVVEDGRVVGAKNVCDISRGTGIYGNRKIKERRITAGIIDADVVWGFELARHSEHSEDVSISVGRTGSSDSVVNDNWLCVPEGIDIAALANYAGSCESPPEFSMNYNSYREGAYHCSIIHLDGGKGFTLPFTAFTDVLAKALKTSSETGKAEILPPLGMRFGITVGENYAWVVGNPTQSYRLPVVKGGIIYDANPSSDRQQITATIKHGDESISAVTFPVSLDNGFVSYLQRALLSDTDWISLPRSLPVQYSIRPLLKVC